MACEGFEGDGDVDVDVDGPGERSHRAYVGFKSQDDLGHRLSIPNQSLPSRSFLAFFAQLFTVDLHRWN